MSDGFAVDTGRLRDHAGAIRDAQNRSAEAVDAGHQVTPGGWDNAYGVICQSFPQLLRPTAERGIDAISQVTNALGTRADQLTKTADAYDELEQRIAEQFGDILRQLDRLSAGPK